MTDVDLSQPKQIRTYLKENLSEGYLSEEEGLNVDEFVDRYEKLLEFRESIEQTFRNVYEGKVR